MDQARESAKKPYRPPRVRSVRVLIRTFQASGLLAPPPPPPQ